MIIFIVTYLFWSEILSIRKFKRLIMEHSDLDGKQREVTGKAVKKLTASSWLLPTFVTEGKRRGDGGRRKKQNKEEKNCTQRPHVTGKFVVEKYFNTVFLVVTSLYYYCS